MASQMDRIEDKIDKLFDEVTGLKVSVAKHDLTDKSVEARLTAIEAELRPLKQGNIIASAVLKAIPLTSAGVGIAYTIIRLAGGH